MGLIERYHVVAAERAVATGETIKEGQKKLEKRVDYEVSEFSQHIALVQSDIQSMRTEAGIHNANIKEWITDLKVDIKNRKDIYHWAIEK